MKTKKPISEQGKRFIEAARELKADASEEAFDKALRTIGKAKVEKPKENKKK